MDKGVAALLGAMGALATAGPSRAAPGLEQQLAETMQTDSYADLLKPIPNAAALRRAFADSQAAEPPAVGEPAATDVQYDAHHHHHHHHRYHRRYRRPHHHHHHHHHNHDGAVVIP